MSDQSAVNAGELCRMGPNSCSSPAVSSSRRNWTAELYGKPVLGLNENDICFSAAKLYFAYGLGNALTFPLSVGASVVLMAERPCASAQRKTPARPVPPHR